MALDAANLLGRLMGYAETWWQDPGYGGLFIHPCWSVTNLHYCGPHTPGNAAALRAFLTLYRRFGRKQWLERSIACADLLVSFARPSGVFRNSTAEYDPEEGCLVHNALPDIALLTLAAFLSEEGGDARRADRYIDVARRNIDWFVSYWWNGRYFCGTINQDVTALTAMALYQKIAGPSGFTPYIDAVISYCQSMVEHDGPAVGAIQRSEEPDGRVFATSYQAGKALALLDLAEVHEDERILPLAVGAARFVVRQRRTDGYFDWGYLEEGGKLQKKTYPLPTSVGIARCGYRFKRFIMTFDWMAYLDRIIPEVPMRVTAQGFGESGTGDWRSRASSPDNVSTMEFLASIAEREPLPVPFNDLVLSRGPDVMAGNAWYVFAETPQALFRIAEGPSPAVDLVVSKHAELPVVHSGVENEASFAIFSDDKPEDRWTCDASRENDGIYRYFAGDRERLFRLHDASIEVIQRPYPGVPIRFEASPRGSSINRLVAMAGGKLFKEGFVRLDGRCETVIEPTEPWFSICNTSLRLLHADVRVSLSRPIRRLVMDHRCANPQGRLRVTITAEACEELIITIQPGHFAIPGYKHIN